MLRMILLYLDLHKQDRVYMIHFTANPEVRQLVLQYFVELLLASTVREILRLGHKNN